MAAFPSSVWRARLMPYESQTHPLCRCCGKPIPRFTRTIYVVGPNSVQTKDVVVGPLYSKEDCQRHTNHRVVSVRYDDARHDDPDQRRKVWRFTTWDGVSYEDEFFCKGTCATRFAYVMAHAGHCTVAYKNALAQRVIAKQGIRQLMPTKNR